MVARHVARWIVQWVTLAGVAAVVLFGMALVVGMPLLLFVSHLDTVPGP
ncbi:hypothetical protein Kpho02_32100 [Kitasatospora phosalacinea]|uniref:Uncharacterized protein n=1 Tax=Kitasatospora phosalacinea TaxID=2065 RepID=A0A9W6Q9G6_9ACTN|nr:hypothetical protein [Kitasatospora phosalacinea]GLW70911.1 hypothetical protein Kpho02_32100 [Kitasatospora phosalacinea]